MGFTLAFCAVRGLLCDLDGETSCILYFLGISKYMKKSFWSHLSALF